MLYTLRIYTADLEIGMFVSGLDRPWLDTPFVVQGFRIENREELDRLRGLCEYVYVDCQKSQQDASVLQRKVRIERPRIPLERIFSGRPLKPYDDGTALKEEWPRAQVALETLVEDISEIFDHVSDNGTLNLLRLKRSVDPILDSISRNPDACLWLTRLKQHDEYTYQHSLSVSIWAVALGRQIGLHRRDLRSLAIGGLLMDVGKLWVRPELLRAEHDLAEAELEEVRDHVRYGIAFARESGVMNQDVLDIVAHHHERHDGSGYPQGLSGKAIPPVAQIAGIVDTYDALTTERTYARAISPSNAIKVLYESRDVAFPAELVEAFIQAVGIYPAGTLVELSSGEIGVVVAESRTRRLRPKVMILLDEAQRKLEQPRKVDLLAQAESEGAAALSIVKSLEPGAFGINFSQSEIREASLE
jgi:HD-GYP domain-containing protein (c-di-GMP phosphodiesterase class II)